MLDPNSYNVLILAGDVASGIRHLESIFMCAKSRYDSVCFVPGNHELWKTGMVSGAAARASFDSIDKLKEVLYCARACDVSIGPVRISNSSCAIVIFPMYSWYHSSWDKGPINSWSGSNSDNAFLEKWVDFALCSWPSSLVKMEDFVSTSSAANISLAHAFASLNEPFLSPDTIGAYPLVQHTTSKPVGNTNQNSSATLRHHMSPMVQEGDTVISFSHFLPRRELCRYSVEPMLPRVSGSDPLEAQIRRLKPHVHIFGHTHIPADVILDGIRYIQWPLGYQRYINLDRD